MIIQSTRASQLTRKISVLLTSRVMGFTDTRVRYFSHVIGRNAYTSREGKFVRKLSSILPSSIHSLREQKIIDDKNLLQFDTLHELQNNATIAFSHNPLFGTYVDEGFNPRFEYMDYKTFGEKVELCRTVLKNLGKFAVRDFFQFANHQLLELLIP